MYEQYGTQKVTLCSFQSINAQLSFYKLQRRNETWALIGNKDSLTL